ncbi:MAG: hypothetical protein J6C64_09555 [Lachnospiraceae bacterium]|nr:hypothetical protein [Lachnospiraceae bacterium]
MREVIRQENLAESYKEDAAYYVSVSGVLGAHTEELSASITNINQILNTIDDSAAGWNKNRIDDFIKMCMKKRLDC